VSALLLAALTDALNRAQEALAPQVGNVTAIAGSQVTVSLRGATVTLPRLASYTPTVGDAVIVLPIVNGQKIVLGKPA